MSAINRILDSEKEAQKIIYDANKEAEVLVKEAEKKSEIVFEDFKNKQKKLRKGKVQGQKKVLAVDYREIIENGGKEIGLIEKKVGKVKSEAVSFVVEELTK